MRRCSPEKSGLHLSHAENRALDTSLRAVSHSWEAVRHSIRPDQAHSGWQAMRTAPVRRRKPEGYLRTKRARKKFYENAASLLTLSSCMRSLPAQLPRCFLVFAVSDLPISRSPDPPITGSPD